MLEIPGKYTTARIMTDNVDETTVSQIIELVNHSAFTEPIAIMPDCHAGKGAVIGFTMPLGEQIVPNVVGVDIGCGMLAYKLKGTPLKDPEKLDKAIRNTIPFGTNVHQRSNINTHGLIELDTFFTKVQSGLDSMWMRLREKFGNKVPRPPTVNYDWYMKKCDEIGMDFNRAQMSIGTLGGGNHFIEFGISKIENPDVQSPEKDIDYTWIVVHSGSRQFGEKICKFHQHKATQELNGFKTGAYQAEVQAIIKSVPPAETQKELQKLKERHANRIKIPKGIESLTGKSMYDYLYDMIFAQYYASLNRGWIMGDIMKLLVPVTKKTKTKPWNIQAVYEEPIEIIETVHNYISPDDLIIRKGAVSARQGEKIVIPFNMKDGTWICIGRGDELWNNSAPHGAGRIMSRSKAKEVLDKAEAEKQMEGIYTSCIPIDEAPNAYKSASEIKNAIGPTAGIIEEIKPIMNMKTK